MAISVHDFQVVRFATYLSAMAQEIKKNRSGDKSRLKLLAAAARVLDTTDYRELLVENICLEAGVAKGTFYIYFKSKDEFLRDLAARYTAFELQTYPRLSGRDSEFTNSRKWITWYEQTFAANAGVLRCIVQMGSSDKEMQEIWHERNRGIVDRAMIGWLKTNPNGDPDLQRWIMRTAGSMMDQSLFERYRVLTGPGFPKSDDPGFLIDLHAFLNYRAMYGRNPPVEEFDRESPFRALLEGKATKNVPKAS